jgi:hypothetical protein
MIACAPRCRALELSRLLYNAVVVQKLLFEVGNRQSESYRVLEGSCRVA